jgi:starch phosphorylase
LWWSWHIEARDIFRVLDRPLWKATGHNPVKLLQQIETCRLVAAAGDPEFLSSYDSIMGAFKTDISNTNTWFAANYPHLQHHTIAYFSLEFAIHNSLPIYAGGLGILAGDYCKEASDLGIPLVGVGFMYPEGYLHQHISTDGWQEDTYERMNFAEAPISPVFTSNKQRLKVEIPLDDHSVHATIWQVDIGRVKLYLLDTNVEENSPTDRQLSARLYAGDREMRLQQEIIIGIGGVRALGAMKVKPVIWHANEGHTTFMMLERIRELVEKGLSFTDATRMVRASTIFTTHTPIPAGNDVFPLDLIERSFQRYPSSLGLDRDAFLKLGILEPENTVFNMTVLGLRMAEHCNGVSQLHGGICRKMWHSLWPDVEEKDVPIVAITNGIHAPSWVSPEMARLYQRYLGPDWINKHDDPMIWERVTDIPNKEIWLTRHWVKHKLVTEVQDRTRKRWSEDHVSPEQALAMGALLDAEALTIGFSRRFTAYKRATLILHDLNRLKRILRNELRPVQIIFSGKAHPDDEYGKFLIKEVYKAAKDPEFSGRIAFVEDYDMHLARYMVHGTDVWLNTPVPLREACGTSGQKAALNGVIHLSALDGWWYEGYNGTNGWAIHQNIETPDSPELDKIDVAELYDILEEKVVPLYYERDMDGIPHGWMQMIKETIRSNAPMFSTRRMAKEYTEQMYLAAIQTSQTVANPDDGNTI